MDKNSRARIHQIASGYKLKSGSKGSGSHRFTMLTKMHKSVSPNNPNFKRIEDRFARKIFKAAKKTGDNQISLKGQTGYRDGEVVGASAPEIGEGNRGHAMLERMGWKKGSALGAGDNKGILIPVTHTVKNSRIGLG